MTRQTRFPRIAFSSGAGLAASLALALAATALTPVATHQAAQAASTRVTESTATQRVKLGLNKSIVIDLPTDAYDILVANPAVADAVTRTARRIYLFGKQVGETNIFVFGPNGEQIASLDLQIERDVSGLEDYLKRFLPDSTINVELINDNVVLTGEVATPLDAQRAQQLATIFVSGGEATTGQYATTATGVGTSGGGADVDISNPDSERRTSRIVNLLKIVGEDQVTLKVTVAEISRTVMKQLGVRALAAGSTDGISFASVADSFTGLGKPLTNLSSSLTATIGSVTLQSYLNAMEQTGVMKTLAEPTLTAVSGEQAQFRVGGEFNMVNDRGEDNGQVTYTVSKVEYGIGLEFLPVVLSPGRISLKIRTTVSEPTTQGSVSIAETNIISIRKRLADTTVELPSGGTMMIAGLIQDDVRQNINGMPGLMKLPVLGTLFRSRSFERNETELVVLVTPYLSRPVARNAMAKPDDNFNPPSDGAGMFLGRVNRVYGTMKTNRPAGRYHGVVGYIYK
ncbi:MAG: pilus assembly protein CpaC [Phyllobacteriaceae bacterium]|nr:pilus assembly protein CpaC [Phyllobacteriaceae bacterium]MBA92625.1 pilus assembly protein CpaC [Phyllobacteriaceae bacterium]